MGSKPGPAAPLTAILLERIRQEGPLTFAAYMEACLYHSEHGYYNRPSAVAPSSDYLTSPEVSPVFGRLLAWQLREMWECLEEPAPFDLVELGAGRGCLAREILSWSDAHAPRWARAVRYHLVETSPRRRQQAQVSLERWQSKVSITDCLPPRELVGCLFSNELVDALPVHRVVQRATGLEEIYVDEREGGLVERIGALSSPKLADYLKRYGVPLATDQFAEIHLAALAWLETMTRGLERGFLLTIDYGYRARELYGPAHRRGTLLAYHGHRAQEDWLSRPGEQDLSAHVNFTALLERGRELGLVNLGYVTQTQFLLALARATEFSELHSSGATEREKIKARQAFKQLIHPEAMGEAFKVLIQTRGLDRVELAGLASL